MKTLFAILILAAVSFGQTVVNVKSLTLSPDATAAVNSWMVTQVTGTPTGLNGTISPTDTVVTVDDGSVMGNNDVLVIEGEAMQITAKAAKKLTVTRGAFGTTATDHKDKTIVSVMKYRTYAILFQTHIANVVASIMDTAGYPTKATQDAIVATATAAKQAAKDSAVQ